jgi:hypothetical protein
MHIAVPRDIFAIVDRLQEAADGSQQLDALIGHAFRRLGERFTRDGLAGPPPLSAACWSRELSAALDLLPEDYNFSVGKRDGICWAWIQPNDDWQPGELESRHDHPQGSGLVVAYTAALALAAAAIMLYASRATTPLIK